MKKKRFLFMMMICIMFTLTSNNVLKAENIENEDTKSNYTVYVDLNGGSIGNDTSYEIYGATGETYILQVPEREGYVLTGYTCDYGEIQSIGGNGYTYQFSNKNDVISAVWRADNAENTTVPKTTNMPDISDIRTEAPIKTEEPANNHDVVSIIKMTANNNKIKFSSGSSYQIYLRKSAVFQFSGKNIYDLTYQIVEKGKTLDTAGWKTVWNNKITVSKKNAWNILYIRYKTESGSYVRKKTKGFYIDKTAPTISGIKNNAVYKSKVNITYKDGQSGIKSAKLNGKSIKSGKVVSKNGTYKVVAADKAGNKKTVSFQISTPKPTKKPAATKSPTPKPQTTTAPTITTSTTVPKKTEIPKTTSTPQSATQTGSTVQSITLSKSTLTLSVGQSATLTATVLPSNAKNKNVTWKSTQPFVASVSSTGRVVACAKGRTTIIVVSKANSKVTKSCTVLVK